MHLLSATIAIALLAVFLAFSIGLKYAMRDDFSRTRLSMSIFFLFIVATLSISFWKYALDTLPYAIPAAAAGVGIGHGIGVRAAERRLDREGVVRYRKYFARITPADAQALSWWTVINFYSVMGSLVLINLVGFTTVILYDARPWAIATSAVGAFLIGTVIPYLVHLWGSKLR